MTLTRDLFNHRLEVLDKQKRDLQATLYAIDGAQEDCRFWLAKLDEEDPPEEG